jgi:hypothetical protein
MVKGPSFRAYTILSGVFVLGALSGAGLGYAYSQQAMAALASEDRSEGRDLRRLNAFTRKLELSDSQRERVRGIVERYRPERERHARRMFESCGEELLRVKRAMDGEIRAILSPEQQQRFDAMRERRERFIKGK